MSEPVFDRMACVDLGRKEHTVFAEDTREQDFSEDACLLGRGRFSGTLLPASCLLTARIGKETVLLTGTSGAALARTGLEAVLITGRADVPIFLLIQDEKILFLPDPAPDSPSRQKRETLLSLCRQNFSSENAFSLLLTGPAAQTHFPYPSVILETGLCERSFPLARWMAAHGLSGLALSGSKPPLPIAADHPLRNLVSFRLPERNYADIARIFGKKCTVSPPRGRALACHACPAPCGFWLPAGSSHMAMTAPEAFSHLLEQGCEPAAIARLFELALDLGLEPLALAEHLPLPENTDTETLLGKTCHLPERSCDATDALAARTGICSLFLRRFPEVARRLTQETD